MHTTPTHAELLKGKSLESWHRDFNKAYSSALGRKMTFARMHFNRIAQSSRIILSNPNIWGKIAKGFVNASRGRKRLLRSLEIALTYRCNAKCEQCSCRKDFDPKKEKESMLTIDELKGVIDQAVDMGAFQFCLNGGEPMLEEERVMTLLDYLKSHHNVYVHLCTNGTLLDRAKIERLARGGLDSVEMGFDSAFETTHDANRVKGGYQRIFKNIKAFQELGVGVVLNTVMTNEKIKSDDIILTMLIAKAEKCLLQITPCCLTGAFKGRMDKMLTDEGKFYFHWLLAATSNNRSDLYSSLTRIKCPAAREKLGLQPYGDVVSCPLIQIKYGNVRENSLEEIQKEMLKDPYYNLTKSEGCLPAMSEKFIRERLM